MTRTTARELAIALGFSVTSFLGALLGSRIPGFSGKKAGILGGAVLIAIGIKLLLEGIL